MIQSGKKLKGYKYPKHKKHKGVMSDLGKGLVTGGRLLGESSAQMFGVNEAQNIRDDAKTLKRGFVKYGKKAAGKIMDFMETANQFQKDSQGKYIYHKSKKAKHKKHKSKKKHKIMCKKSHVHHKLCK
jgi:hypothetical protein